jgi:Schlafen, AlbA_2
MSYAPIYTPDDVKARLIIGRTREDHGLDFKDQLGKDNAENAGDVAQFANGSGGVLVIGAQEADQVLTGFVTVSDSATVIKRIEDIVKAHLTPVPIIEPHAIEITSGLRIVAVNVPPSLVLIARHEKHERFEFLIRGHESKRRMTLMEVEARLQNRERAMKLRLDVIPHDAPVGLDAFVREIGHNDWRVVGVDDDVVRLVKNGAELVVPLAYVEAVYQAGEPEAQWVIRVPCYIARHRQTHRLHLTRELSHGVRQENFSSRGLD